MNLRVLFTFAAVTIASLAFAEEQPTIKDHDRIVFIGDSITGQGALGGKAGWIALIGEGLSLVRPEAKPTLIGLGGSGSTVGAWLNFEKRSRTESLTLDVKGLDVGQTLDAGAEVLVVMLGMNDVLSPSLKDNPADFDAWIARYRELVEALRARSHPRVVALATVTPCTEDEASPKNRVLGELNQRLVKLAGEQHFLVLPTAQTAFQMLRQGRAMQPNFHITGDFVHPNPAGHLAIARGMLTGLGEWTAAQQLVVQHETLLVPAPEKLPTISSLLFPEPGGPDDAKTNFVVRYEWTHGVSHTPPIVKATTPPGWTSTLVDSNETIGSFRFSGPLGRAENKITLTATSGDQTREQVITIPAAWRIAVGEGQGLGWTRNTDYDPAQDRGPLDEKLAAGEGLTSPVPFPTGEPGPWTRYIASADYTGLNKPGSVDMAAVVFFHYKQQAYGARWIYSERDRPVNVNISSQSFAGTYSLGAWLNGHQAYAGKLMGEPAHKATAASTLHAGWNLLVFKSTFIQWQWQFSIDLAGYDGDDLADLRYATEPPLAQAR